MVELTGNSESFGVISHGFNNWVFLIPAVVTIPLIGMSDFSNGLFIILQRLILL